MGRINQKWAPQQSLTLLAWDAFLACTQEARDERYFGSGQAQLNLENAVESRKSAQAIDSSNYMKKVLITNKVTDNSSCIICIPYVRVGNHAFFHYAI